MVRTYECDCGHRWVAWKPHEEGKHNCPVCTGKLRDLAELEKILEDKKSQEMLLCKPTEKFKLDILTGISV